MYKNSDLMKHKSLRLWALTGIIILVASSFFIYILWEEKEKMDIDVLDGYNIDSEHGCFFILLAGRGVHLDLDKYTFWVAEKGESPIKLDLDFRHYDQDRNRTPLDGDQNSSYRYVGGREWGDGIWNAGQAIAFDMPHKSAGIDIEDNTVYVIFIKNQDRDVVWRGEFIYKIE